MIGDKLVLRAVEEGNWRSIRPELEKYLPEEGVVFSDQGNEFARIGKEFGLPHYVCNHQIREYKSIEGATTSRIEGTWAHLKRQQKGIYRLMSRKYAQYYLDEFAYRWNTRNETPPERVKNYFPNIRVVITWKELKMK